MNDKLFNCTCLRQMRKLRDITGKWGGTLQELWATYCIILL